MPNRNFVDLVPRVATSVVGAPNPLIEQYIRDAAIEVCEKALVWRYDQPLIRLTPNVYDYPYEPPSQSEVHAVLTAYLNDQSKLQLVTLDDLHDQCPQWPNGDSRGAPTMVAQLDSDNFVVAPIPDDVRSYDIHMVVALKPLREAAFMDKTVLDDIEQVVIHGALQHLLVLPDKNWTNKELGAYHAQQYIYKTAERRARANLGNARGSLFVQQRSFA